MKARNLKMDVPSELEQLVDGFLSRRAMEVDELSRHLEKGDFPSIAFIGHRLKGNGAGYGFPALSEIGAELEQVAASRNKATCSALIAELRDALSVFRNQS